MRFNWAAWTLRCSRLGSLFHHPSPDDLDFVHGPILAVRLDQTHALNHPHPTLDPAKNRVLSIQPWRRRERNEKLTTVRVRSAVRHAQDPCAGMLQVVANLVLEFLAVDRAASSTGAGGIAGLNHKVGDDAVEDHIVVIASLRKGSEVLATLVRDCQFKMLATDTEVYEPWAHECCKARR